MGIVSILRDSLFSGRCAGCGKTGSWLCPRCVQRMTMQHPECYVCRRLSLNYKTHEKCLSNKNPFNTVSILWRYDSIAAKLMSAYKFSYCYGIQDSFDRLIKAQESRLQNICNTDVIVPMPLHKKRVNERGFDSVQHIANSLKSILPKPAQIVENLLLRTVNNPHQAFVKKELRQRLVEDIFAVNYKSDTIKRFCRQQKIDKSAACRRRNDNRIDTQFCRANIAQSVSMD